MRLFREWSIRARLFLAFGGILISFAVFASMVMDASRDVLHDVSIIQMQIRREIEKTMHLKHAWDQLALAIKDYKVAGGPEERMQIEQRAAHFEAAFRSLTDASFDVTEERQLIEMLGGIVADVEARSRRVLAASNPSADPEAIEAMDSIIRLNEYILPILRRFQEIYLAEIDALVQRTSDRSLRTETTTFAAMLLGVAGVTILSIIFSNWLSRPIAAITYGSRRMADGDLSQRVEADVGGELEEAAAAFNRMAARLEASATENARLYAAATQRAERIAAINRLIKVISSSLDLGKVYEAFARELKQFLPFVRMGVVLPDSSGKQLRVFQLATDQPGEANLGKVWSNGKGTGIEWVMMHRQSHIEADLAEAGLFVEDGTLLKEGIRSTVRLPLIVKGEVIGAFFLDDVEPDRYTESDLDLLIPLSEQIAIAIENARLHDELERKVEERTKALQETQAQLIQSGKLAAVGTLAAGVAHELNQPLMVIRGYAQELLTDERLIDEEIRDDLRRIEAQTTRMTAIINHLRDFSRQSKGRRQATDLNQVVTGALTFLEQQLKARNITVIRDLAPALPAVWADPMQIEQVLLNLITNARDAMEQARMRTITIRTDLGDAGQVRLSVTDTGPGIPADIRPRIFDPFFTTKEVGKGTGLGLSICHGIVEEHGGELTIQSPVIDGRGACFTMALPRSLRDDNRNNRI